MSMVWSSYKFLEQQRRQQRLPTTVTEVEEESDSEVVAVSISDVTAGVTNVFVLCVASQGDDRVLVSFSLTLVCSY